jgi:hypothetical protein
MRAWRPAGANIKYQRRQGRVAASSVAAGLGPTERLTGRVANPEGSKPGNAPFRHRTKPGGKGPEAALRMNPPKNRRRSGSRLVRANKIMALHSEFRAEYWRSK